MKVDDDIEVPELGGTPMQTMYDLQMEVLREYQKIESLPDWPLDLTTKENQVLIKDFSARVIEELGEAYENIRLITQSIPSYTESKRRGNKDWEQINKDMINWLWSFNEELSDALHFMIELNIFSDIPVNDIIKYADAYELACTCDEYDMDMKYFMKAGLTLIANRKDLTENETPIHIHSIKDAHFIIGGRIMSDEILQNVSKLMWEITHELQMSKNCLKKKPWKQTESYTDVKEYRKRLIMANLRMFSLFRYLTMQTKNVFEIYYRKNRVNLHRIKTKY